MVFCLRHSVYLFSLSRPLWSLMLDTVSTYSPCCVHCGHSCVTTQFIFYYEALCLSAFDHAHSLPIPSCIMIFTDNTNTVSLSWLLLITLQPLHTNVINSYHGYTYIASLKSTSILVMITFHYFYIFSFSNLYSEYCACTAFY